MYSYSNNTGSKERKIQDHDMAVQNFADESHQLLLLFNNQYIRDINAFSSKKLMN